MGEGELGLRHLGQSRELWRAGHLVVWLEHGCGLRQAEALHGVSQTTVENPVFRPHRAYISMA